MLPHSHPAAAQKPSFFRGVVLLLVLFTVVFFMRMELLPVGSGIEAAKPALPSAKLPAVPPKSGGIGPRPGTKPPSKAEPASKPAANAAAPAPQAAAASPVGTVSATATSPLSASAPPLPVTAGVATAAAPAAVPAAAPAAASVASVNPFASSVAPSASPKLLLLKELLADAEAARKPALVAELKEQIAKLEPKSAASAAAASKPAAPAIEPLKTIAEKTAAKKSMISPKQPRQPAVPAKPSAAAAPASAAGSVPSSSFSTSTTLSSGSQAAAAAAHAAAASHAAASPSASPAASAPSIPAPGPLPAAVPVVSAASPAPAAVSLSSASTSTSAVPVRTKPQLPADQVFDVANLCVIWDFGACGCTGWAAETINFVLGLYERIPKLGIIAGSDCFCPGLDPGVLKVLTHLQKQPMSSWDVDIFISHKPPSRYPVFPYTGLVKIQKRPLYVVGRSMTEIHQVSSEWAARANSMVDEVWLPSSHLLPAFLAGGVDRARMHVLPEPIDTALYDAAATQAALAAGTQQNPLKGKKKAFKFLSCFKWEPRKGWDNLVRAFFEEFTAADNVELHLQTYLYGEFNPRDPARVHERIREFVRGLPIAKTRAEADLPYKQVFVYAEERSTADMPAMYKAANAFVLPTRGEGWGLPLMEAMLMGLPTIATNWSGQLEFMKPANSYLVPVAKMTEAQGTDFAKGQLWAEASIPDLRRIMRSVVTDRKASKARGRIASTSIASQFGIPAVATKVISRLEAIMREQAIVGAGFGKPAPPASGLPTLAELHTFGKPPPPLLPVKPPATAKAGGEKGKGKKGAATAAASSAKKASKRTKSAAQAAAPAAPAAAAAAAGDDPGVDRELIRQRLATVLAEKEGLSAAAGSAPAPADSTLVDRLLAEASQQQAPKQQKPVSKLKRKKAKSKTVR